MEAKEIIARRVALELRDRTLVNLGIGLPTLVAHYVPQGLSVAFQSENGIIGFGAPPPNGMEDPNLTDAGGGFISALPGAASFDSGMSFALIRGGHLDMTVLGGLQVDAQGRLANWMVPGKLVPGMGGAMDLVVGRQARHRRDATCGQGPAQNCRKPDAAADRGAPGEPRRHRNGRDRTDAAGLAAARTRPLRQR